MKQLTKTPVKRSVVRELKKLRTSAAKARSRSHCCRCCRCCRCF